MTREPRAIPFGASALLVVAAFAGAGTPQAGVRFGQKAEARPASTAGGPQGAAAPQTGTNPEVSLCPGEQVSYEVFFVGNAFGTINAGDTVVGTLAFGGMVFQTCQVNAPTTGTCTVAPGGSSISFNLANVQSPPGGDISGTFQVPADAPTCGILTIRVDLTEPYTSDTEQLTPYACAGVPCSVPALGRTGLLVLALLLAAIAVGALVRRSTG